MGNLSEDTIRKTLNAGAVTTGSLATSTTAAYVSTPVTTFTGGVVLTNASSTTAEIIWLRIGAVAASAAATCYPLLPGASIPLALADLHTVSAIAASGTPTIAWVGTTL
jgi:hypothetical protein